MCGLSVAVCSSQLQRKKFLRCVVFWFSQCLREGSFPQQHYREIFLASGVNVQAKQALNDDLLNNGTSVLSLSGI